MCTTFILKKQDKEKPAVKIEFYKLSGIFEFKLHLPQNSKNDILVLKSNIIEAGIDSKKNPFNWIIVDKVIGQTSSRGQSCQHLFFYAT